MSAETFSVPDAEWLREYARNGGSISGHDLEIVADTIEMLGEPMAIRGWDGPTRWAYTKPRTQSLFNRYINMFKRLAEHNTGTERD